MAEKLRKFDFDTTPQITYPWHEWEDCGIWRIDQGADFHVPLKSMQAQLYMRAKQAGMKVRTRFVQDPPGIVFQFVPADQLGDPLDTPSNGTRAVAAAKKKAAKR